MPAELRRAVFADRLRSRMTELKINQTELANRANMTHATVYNYLRGARTPKAIELHKLAEALGTSMDWLWGANTDAAAPEYQQGRTVYLEHQMELLGNQLRCLLKHVDSLHRPSSAFDISGSNTISGGVGNTTITITSRFDETSS